MINLGKGIILSQIYRTVQQKVANINNRKLLINSALLIF